MDDVTDSSKNAQTQAAQAMKAAVELATAQGALAKCLTGFPALQKNLAAYENIAQQFSKGIIQPAFFEQQKIMKQFMPAFEISPVFQPIASSILKSFQIDIPAGVIADYKMPISNTQFIHAASVIAERIKDGTISAEAVEEAEALVEDAQILALAPDAQDDALSEFALHISSAKFLFVLLTYILLLAVHNKEVDLEDFFLAVFGSWVTKGADEKFEDIFKGKDS